MSATLIELVVDAPGVLALGGWLKNAICGVRANTAVLSEPIGDLVDADACEALEQAADRLCAEHRIVPAIVAHDLHPDFFSTRLAGEFARRWRIAALGVQHHHAHIAAVCAEHGVTGPVLGLAMDGVGYGSDGKAWGGELLRVDGASFARLGHVQPLRLAAGDHESGQPWRFAAAVLHTLGRGGEIERRFAGQPEAAIVAERLRSAENVIETTSMGRLLDAAAGLLGVSTSTRFRGQAGLLLEGLAERQGDVFPLAGGWSIEDGNLNLLPLFAALAEEKNPQHGAALFHATLAAALADWLVASAPQGGPVVASGGCLQNQVLGRGLRGRLADAGVHLIEARRIPPNDGGIALGQAWIAQYQLRGRA